MIDTIYTIGYSGFKIDDFVKTLKENGVSVVIDVYHIHNFILTTTKKIYPEY